MKKQKPPEATKTVYPILRQIVNLIPPNIFHAAAAATKDLSRVFTPWSHAVALIYQQLTKTESLNGVCDAARVHASQSPVFAGVPAIHDVSDGMAMRQILRISRPRS